METIPCPGCRTDLEPSATVCHICTRPRNKLEITRAYATLREMEKQRKKRPFIITGRLLAAAAIGGVLFRFHEPMREGLSSAYAFGSKLANDALYPAAAASRPSAAPSPASPNGTVAPAEPSRLSAFTPPSPARSPAVRADSRPSPQPERVEEAKAPRAPVEDLPLPQFDSAVSWAFYGRVYDVVSLRPVSGARLTFGMSSPMVPVFSGVSAISDADGRFSVVLSRLQDGQSYEIHATAAGYVAPALYEPDIPYAKLPLSERRALAASAQDGDVTLPPLTDVAGESSLRRDVFLAPTR